MGNYKRVQFQVRRILEVFSIRNQRVRIRSYQRRIVKRIMGERVSLRRRRKGNSR